MGCMGSHQLDREAWESLHCAGSRPLPKPQSGRIAVKGLNHQATKS